MFLMSAIADRIEARCGAAQVDDRQKERAQNIEPEMRADPRQAERKTGSERDRAPRHDRSDEKNDT